MTALALPNRAQVKHCGGGGVGQGEFIDQMMVSVAEGVKREAVQEAVWSYYQMLAIELVSQRGYQSVVKTPEKGSGRLLVELPELGGGLGATGQLAQLSL